MRKLKKKPVQMHIEPGQGASVSAKKRGVSLSVKDDPAMGLVGLGSSSGKGDVSSRHDEYFVKYVRTRRT